MIADFGTGAFSNLQRFRGPDAVDGIVLSHLHADHFIDVIPLRYALRYGERTHARRIALYLPPGGEEVLRAIVAPLDNEGGSFLDDVYDVMTYDPQATLDIGDVSIRFAQANHYVPCFAMRLDLDGITCTYSADTAPADDIASLAAHTGVLLCEATLSQEEEALEPRGHLSAREAGALAAASAAGALLLSHYPASASPETMRRDAASEYGGRIIVVDDAVRFALREF